VKNLSLILNAVLIVAVAVLYYLHFSTPRATVPAEQPQITADVVKPVSLPIAYVNSDSLLMNYDYYKETRKELETKRQQMEKEINGKARAYENEVVAYQKKGNQMTLEQAQLTEQTLMRKQQELVQYRDRVSYSLAEEEQKKNEELINNISEYLQQYTKDKNYKYILGYTKGGGVWYANDSLEVTSEVLKGLNDKYQAAKNTAVKK
jgi:outer membrane protein